MEGLCAETRAAGFEALNVELRKAQGRFREFLLQATSEEEISSMEEHLMSLFGRVGEALSGDRKEGDKKVIDKLKEIGKAFIPCEEIVYLRMKGRYDLVDINHRPSGCDYSPMRPMGNFLYPSARALSAFARVCDQPLAYELSRVTGNASLPNLLGLDVVRGEAFEATLPTELIGVILSRLATFFSPVRVRLVCKYAYRMFAPFSGEATRLGWETGLVEKIATKFASRYFVYRHDLSVFCEILFDKLKAEGAGKEDTDFAGLVFKRYCIKFYHQLPLQTLDKISAFV